MSDIQEFQNRKGQNIGTYNFDDKTFRKKVKHSKHFFRMRDAWGIDKEVVNTLMELKCEQVRIWDEEYNRIYSISFNDFYQHAVLDKQGNEDHQFFVARQHFNIENRKN